VRGLLMGGILLGRGMEAHSYALPYEADSEQRRTLARGTGP